MFSHTTACKGQTTFPAGLGALLTPSVPGIGFRCVAEAAPPVRCPFQLCGEVEQLEFGSEHDLTAEGSVAWAHWGLDSSFAVNHNIGSGRTAKITAVMIGEGQPVRYDDVSSQAPRNHTPLPNLANLVPCWLRLSMFFAFHLTSPVEMAEWRILLLISASDQLSEA